MCKDLRCISWIDRLIAAHTPHTPIHTHMHAQTRIHCIKSKTSTWLWKNRHKVTTNIHISCCYMQEIYIHLVYMHIYISLVYILYITTYIHIFLYICINLGCTESERAIYIYTRYTHISCWMHRERATDRGTQPHDCHPCTILALPRAGACCKAPNESRVHTGSSRVMWAGPGPDRGK